ncbi:MAG TPA: type II secretion system F family protein [Burkholderiaceae bacterium]
MQLRLEAADGDDARRQVEQQAMKVLDIRAAPIARFAGRAGWTRFSLPAFSQELRMLLSAGLNLTEALQGLVEKEGVAESRVILDRLIERLRSGHRFSAALAEFPAVFPPLFIGLVQACESTGDLPRALQRFVDYRARVDQVRGQVVSASIYPAILVVVGTAVTLFLGGYVVPRFASIYEDTGRELPTATRLMILWGNFAGQHLPAVAASLVALVGAVAWAGVRSHRSGALSALLARLPWVGPRLQLYELARLYLTLGLLLDSGIPVIAALGMSGGVVSMKLRERLESARSRIAAGEAFSEAFLQQALTTSISVRMLRVGEQSGQLGRMLIEAAAFYEGEVGRFIDRFVRVFEPTLMALIGIVVGGIVLLLYMPIFDLAGSLQ